MDWSSIGRNIRQYRLESDLRQEDLASDEALSKAIAAFETQTRSE